VIPIEVIEEIDRFKRESVNWARNARQVFTGMLDGFAAKQFGEGRSNSQRRQPPDRLPEKWRCKWNGHANGDSNILNGNSVDNRILMDCGRVQKHQPKNSPSRRKGLNLRIKAGSRWGWQAEDYETGPRVLLTISTRA